MKQRNAGRTGILGDKIVDKTADDSSSHHGTNDNSGNLPIRKIVIIVVTPHTLTGCPVLPIFAQLSELQGEKIGRRKRKREEDRERERKREKKREEEKDRINP